MAIKKVEGARAIRVGEKFETPGLGHVEVEGIKPHAVSMGDEHIITMGKALLRLLDNKCTPWAIMSFVVWDETQSMFGVDFHHGHYCRTQLDAEELWEDVR